MRDSGGGGGVLHLKITIDLAKYSVNYKISVISISKVSILKIMKLI